MATALEIAKGLRAEAAKLIAAADILDPPKKKKPGPKPSGRRKRSTNGRRKTPVSADSPASTDGGAPNGKTTLDMGTAGHTTAGDKDAKALAESLVHTTEEPA